MKIKKHFNLTNILFGAMVLALLWLIWNSLQGGDTWKDLRPNFVAELAGIIFTLVFVNVYLEGKEKSKWKGLEKYVRERLIRAMYKSTSSMEVVADVNQNYQLLEKFQQDNLTAMVKYHAEFIGHQLLPVNQTIIPQAFENDLKIMADNLDALKRELDNIVGNFFKHMESEEAEKYMALYQQAEHLHIQINYCLTLFEAKPNSVPETIKEYAKSSASNALPGFLDALVKAELACSHSYEKTIR